MDSKLQAASTNDRQPVKERVKLPVFGSHLEGSLSAHPKQPGEMENDSPMAGLIMFLFGNHGCFMSMFDYWRLLQGNDHPS